MTATSPAQTLSSKTGGKGEAPTIMIVDDDPVTVKVFCKYLKEFGYERFLTTCQPTEAFGIIRQRQPDVVLLDIMMPEVSGIDVLRWMRSEEELQHIPVLILTAATDEDVKRQVLELGATDFLNKPVDTSELAARVRNALIVKEHHDHSTARNATVYKRSIDLSPAIGRELKHKLKDAREEIDKRRLSADDMKDVLHNLSELTDYLQESSQQPSLVKRYWGRIHEVAPTVAGILKSSQSMSRLLGSYIPVQLCSSFTDGESHAGG